MELYTGLVEPEASGPEGRELAFYPTAGQPGTVAGVINHLRTVEDVRAKDIVVRSHCVIVAPG